MKVSWFSFSFSCFLLFNLAVSLSVTTVQTEDTDSPEVPREFPKLDQNYIFVENSSIRENLVHHAVTDTEVFDLLVDEDNLEDNTTSEELPQTTEAKPQEEVGPESQVEWIEDGDNTEDNKLIEDNETEIESVKPRIEETTSTSTTEASTEIKTEAISTTVAEETPTTTEESTRTTLNFNAAPLIEPYKDGVALIDGSVAAILVGVFLVVCVFGYTALILWRKSLETKYGSREMLVDKDDFYDPDDMRHFSI